MINLPLFTKIVEDHVYYPVCLFIVALGCFNIGLLIGYIWTLAL